MFRCVGMVILVAGVSLLIEAMIPVCEAEVGPNLASAEPNYSPHEIIVKFKKPVNHILESCLAR